jgi:deoxycytidylate deaminase
MTSPQQITAIIYDKKGRVLSIGQNSYVRSHPHQAFHANKVGLPEKIFLHAETHAIVKCRDLSKAHSIFISRFSKEGRPLIARPCIICQSAITAAGIKHISHT